jgi:hypothetical protein
MTPEKPKDLRQIILHTDLIEQALRQAGTEALIRHKRLGTPIVVWRDGKVVWIPAEEIEIPGADPRENEAQNAQESVKG